MNIKDQEKLHRFFIEGFQVLIYSGRSDEAAMNIRKDTKLKDKGYSYDSYTCGQRPLSEVDVTDVKVYQQIPNWQEILINPTEINPA